MSRIPQVEVITSVERRRRFTHEEKVRIITESLKPGVSIVAVAKRYDLAPRLLYMWKNRLKRAGLLELPARHGNAAYGNFLQAATVSAVEDAVIRIHCQEQLIADFPSGIDPKRLAAIIHALRNQN